MVEKLTVIFFIILCLLLGFYLILSPWDTLFGNWGENYLLVFVSERAGIPVLQKTVASNWFRGAVTGLGVFNLLIAFWEAAHFKQSVAATGKGRELTQVRSLPSERPLICLITKGDAMASNLSDKRTEILSIVKAAVDAGIPMVQIREKQLTGRALFELTSDAVKITVQTRTRLLVNDRADIALAALADGVHLTRASLSPALIRQKFPSDFIIGVSTHSLDASEAAMREGADFVTFGPVFESPGKGPAVGLDELGRVCAAIAPFPVLALGGIDESNYAAAFAQGARGFAAIRFLNDSTNLEKFDKLMR